MTRLELQSFLEIIRSGSITAAADRIHISQPALSRRIRALEEELGYPLFSRGKGVRAVRLTDKGSLFIPVAEKFLRVYQEAAALSRLDQNPVLRLSAVGSLSTYLLPGVFHAFLDQRRYNLSFNNCHSYEAYAFVESGMADLALISDDMYSREVATVPAFQEPFVFVGKTERKEGERVRPAELKAENEIRLPWNPEFDVWHERHFDGTVYPNVSLDHMTLLEEFLTGENWVIAPLTVARGLKGGRMSIRRVEDGPEDRIIYYLVSGDKKREMIDYFLELLHRELTAIEGIKSFLGR